MDTADDIAPRIDLDEQQGQTFSYLVRIMQRLLGEQGCPWDREQTELSLRQYVLEEACEVIDAIDSGDPAAVCDELGDLSLQVVFLAELARKKRQFGPDDVIRAITSKLVRRHPHVFGEVTVTGADDVVRNWEAIKKTEKAARPLLASIPRSMPALQRAERLSTKVAGVGFDWPDAAGSQEKVREELRELDEAVASADPGRMQSELGDVLFALVNYARHLGLDVNAALQGTCDKFVRRFAGVERRVLEKHGSWPKPSEPAIGLDELDGYWDMAKAEES